MASDTYFNGKLLRCEIACPLFIKHTIGEDALQLKIFIDGDANTPVSFGDLLLEKYRKNKDGKPNLELKRRKNSGLLFPKNKRIGFQIPFDEKLS